MQTTHSPLPVVIAGGGLAGLTAALFLARSGLPVTLYEQAPALGGRARSRTKDGFTFNLGPHALYRSGAGAAILAELGIAYTGRAPRAKGMALVGNDLHTLPYTPLEVLSTSLFSWPEKMALITILPRLVAGAFRPEPTLSLAEWVRSVTSHPRVREFLLASARVATYANAPEESSAAAALEQVRRAVTDSVVYIDGGWQRLVDGLRSACEDAGVEFVESSRISAICRDAFGAANGVHLADGRTVPAAGVILTGSPQSIGAIVGPERMPATPPPVRAAVLDVALRRLPDPETLFALGIDQPLYFSVHSASAQLTPPGGALIHTAKYLPTGESNPERDEQQLLALLDRLQPGWQAHTVEQRFLPELTVSNGLVAARQGGPAGRIDVDGLEIPGLLIAGDWVGPEGMLADAAFASARRAAHFLGERLGGALQLKEKSIHR